MNLFRNVFICATKILISKNTFIVWHNRMKIGWCGIFTKKNQMKTMISCHMFQNFSMFIMLCKNFPGKSILKVWLLLVKKVNQLVYMNSFMSWIHSYMNSFIIVTCTKDHTMNLYLQWIHVYQKLIIAMNSSNRHVFRQANLCCINNQMWISLFTCPKGNQWITAGHDKNSALENLCCTLQR